VQVFTTKPGDVLRILPPARAGVVRRSHHDGRCAAIAKGTNLIEEEREKWGGRLGAKS
jgi:hypothetical protein